MRAALVLNINAARFRRRSPLAAHVRAAAGPDAAVWATGTLDELEDAAHEIARRDPERIVLCGGDGTFMASLGALRRAYGERALPLLVLAPAGTAATVPRAFGQRADLGTCVRRAVSPAPLDVVERATLSVTGDNEPSRTGFIFGTGLVARFFDRYYAAGGAGYGTAARIVARIFAGSLVADRYSRSVLDPLPCRLLVDGVPLAPTAWSLIVSSTIRDLGLHMLVTYRGGEDPERPHLVASPLTTRALGPQAPRVLLGRPLAGAGNFDGLVRRFEIDFADAPGPYVLDGDIFRAARVRVEAGPRIRVARV